MKNKEKYSKEILGFAISDVNMAVEIRTNKPISCYEISDCNLCIAHKSDNICCKEKVKAWAEEEYQEPPILDEKEKEYTINTDMSDLLEIGHDSQKLIK